MSMNIKDEALAARALDGDTRSVYDFPNVAFWGLCEKHLRHARTKHPFFADCTSSYLNAEWFECHALSHKNELADDPSVENVLLSEVYEFLAELCRGDMARAREEAADIVAVVLRASEGDHLKKGGNQ